MSTIQWREQQKGTYIAKTIWGQARIKFFINHEFENILKNRNQIWNLVSKSKKRLPMKVEIINETTNDQWIKLHWNYINTKMYLKTINNENNYVKFFENMHQELKLRLCMTDMDKTKNA